jgi:predicted HTH transcriptional regulator
MTHGELHEILQSGESSTIEFKTEDVHPGSLASEIVAFSNFEGGRILLGIDDNGKIVGCTRQDIEEFVVSICRNNIVPSLIPQIERYTVIQLKRSAKGLSMRCAIGIIRSAARLSEFFFRSPGGLPNTLTLESMRYRQFTRNQTIASFLAGYGYMERRGKGILRMLKACEQQQIDCRLSLSPDAAEFVVTYRPIPEN